MAFAARGVIRDLVGIFITEIYNPNGSAKVDIFICEKKRMMGSTYTYVSTAPTYFARLLALSVEL